MDDGTTSRLGDKSGRHSEVIFNIREFTANAGEQPFREFEVGGDSMASCHIVRDQELLVNLRQADQPATIIGLAGEQVVTLIGDFGPFTTPAWYVPDAPCNIVSMGLAIDDGAVREYDEYWDEDILTVGNQRFHFARRSKGSRTYTCDFSRIAAENINAADLDISTEKAMCVFETEEDVAQVYTQRERKMAAEAKELFARMAFPSIKGLINLLRKGKIRNCEMTPRDVLNCVRIHGVDLAAVQGRTTRKPMPAVRSVPGAVPIIGDEEVDLYVDIMFVNKHNTTYITF